MDKSLVLKTLGVKILKNKPLYTDIDLVGSINGFFIFPYNYYWVVKGKMPLKYANELYEFRNELEIRVAGGANSNKPLEWCTSDEYEEYSNEQNEQFELIGLTEFCNRLESKKVELMKNNIDSFYIAMYHIDKLEGLKKVVDTIKKYNIRTEW